MASRTGVAMLVALAAVVGGGGIGQAARRRTCPPAGAKLLAHDAILRVYETGTQSIDVVNGRGRFRRSTGTFACDTRTGARMTLVGPPIRTFGLRRAVDSFVLAGPIVAYIETQSGIDTGTRSIHVIDVATRRVLREVSGAGGFGDAGFLGYESITEIVVDERGALAWISERGRRGFHEVAPTFAVHAAGVTGPPRVLDEGPGIGQTSLSLEGGTLRWWHDGVQRSAPLP
jgi:hypothetical protein